MQTEQHSNRVLAHLILAYLVLDSTVVDAGRRHAYGFAVDEFPTAILQAGKRFPVVEFTTVS
jgi:hypothetical protein